MENELNTKSKSKPKAKAKKDKAEQAQTAKKGGWLYEGSRNTSIQTRLRFTFGFFGFLLTLVFTTGLIAVFFGESIDSKVYEKQIVPMDTITRVIEDLLVASSCFDMAILSDDPAEIEDYRKQVEQINAELPDLIDSFRPTIASDEEGLIFDSAVQVYTDIFVQKSPQVFKLIADGKVDEANDVMESIDVKISTMVDGFRECRIMTSETNLEMNSKNAESYRGMKISLIAVFAVVILFITVMCYVVPADILRPVNSMNRLAQFIADSGNLQLPPKLKADIEDAAGRGDEAGQTVKSMICMIKMFTSRANSLDKIANGDLSETILLSTDSDTIGSSTKTMLSNLNSLLRDINISATQVSEGSRIVSNSSQQLSQATSEQSQILGELNNIIEGITISSQESTQKLNEAADLGSNIKKDAEMGTKLMNDMVTAVNEISEASRNISEVMKAIDDIAFQTNLLALNASVEAARAGLAGKGFAVVADEVGNLATKSAIAAKETARMVEESMQKTMLGTRIATETSQSLSRIVNGINTSTDIISEIAEASTNQNSDIAQLSHNSHQIYNTIQTTAAVSEECSASAEEMSGQAESLLSMVERFRLR